MLSAIGCSERRQRFWKLLDPPPESDHVILSDPLHLTYLANYWVDPISLGAGFPAYLIVRKDGHAKLLHEDRAPRSTAQAHAEETRVSHWYDGQSPGKGPRQLACLESVNPSRQGLRIHDRPGDVYAPTVVGTLAQMRRQKDPDEIAVLRLCMRAAEAGQAWALAHVQPGMSELDVYAGVAGACLRAAGMPVVVYGDFTVCPGSQKHGGPPTQHILEPGEMIILDYSVVIFGYRGDFTNTIVVGGNPRPDQERLERLCVQAMAAGEKELRAGAECQRVYDAVNGVFEREGVAEHFPHHAGHGIGLTHPEAPFLVRHSNETLLEGDVVTLEPGLYVDGVGGVRIEHNYLITKDGYERLSNHQISLTAR